jgi:hypothetical protein
LIGELVVAVTGMTAQPDEFDNVPVAQVEDLAPEIAVGLDLVSDLPNAIKQLPVPFERPDFIDRPSCSLARASRIVL